MRCSVCGMEGNPSERFCRECGKVFEEGEYYIWKKGTTQPLGPITESDLKGQLAASQLTKDDSIARVGEQNWTPLWQTPFGRETTPLSKPNYYPQPGNPQFANQPVYPNYGGPQPNFGNQQMQVAHQQPFMQPMFGQQAGIPENYQRGDFLLGQRFVALFIDALIAMPLAIMAVIPFLGIIGAPLFCLYLISRDALLGGQSVGKRVMGLKVVKSNGQPFTWGDSVQRNIIYFAALALIIPWAGIILHKLIAFPLGIVELILILSNGQRMGDRMANTYVVRADPNNY